MENSAESPLGERGEHRGHREKGVLRACATYIVACAIVLLAVAVVLPAAGIAADLPLRVLLVLTVIGLPVVALRARNSGGTSTAATRSTTFVERRVLQNMAPINDKRHGGYSEGEQSGDYHWVITAETGALSGLRYGVAEAIVVGRSLESDLALVNPEISRRHARFYVQDEQLFVEDLDSTLGTVVNGRQIDAARLLEAGDEVRFHDIVFRVGHGGGDADGDGGPDEGQ